MMHKRPKTETGNADGSGSTPKLCIYPRSATELARLEEEGHDLSIVRRIRGGSAHRRQGK